MICHLCKKPGHFKRACKTRQKNNEGNDFSRQNMIPKVPPITNDGIEYLVNSVNMPSHCSSHQEPIFQKI